MHPHSLERSNGQTDAKRRFRSTNLHTFSQTHTWTSTHTWTIHTHIPFENYFLISQLLQVSHDLIYFGSYIVIYCYKFSRNHAAQKQKHIYMVTWFNKGVMAMQQIKDDFFLIIMVLDQLHIRMEKKNEPWPLPYAHIKTDSRWMRDLNMKNKIIKLLQDNKQKDIFMT